MTVVPKTEVLIRRQQAQDLDAIRAVTDAAFVGQTVVEVFQQLRATATDILSLVAMHDAKLVAHVLCSPVSIESNGLPLAGMGLGELAVLPACQRQGIGGQLVRQALDELAAQHCPFVIVIGHAAYYPRFGFVPGHTLGLRCQWPGIPAPTFMVRVLDAAAMTGVSGVARYRDVP